MRPFQPAPPTGSENVASAPALQSASSGRVSTEQVQVGEVLSVASSRGGLARNPGASTASAWGPSASGVVSRPTLPPIGRSARFTPSTRSSSGPTTPA
ncbi:MAG: hypothetical protein QM704_02550 [Anaeromyxobacteraceae bacterium]